MTVKVYRKVRGLPSSVTEYIGSLGIVMTR